MSDDEFATDRAAAAALLDQEDVDGFFVAVARGEEYDYSFAHRTGDAERVGMQALSLLAQHLLVIARETGVPVEQVAEDAARFADAMTGALDDAERGGVGGGESDGRETDSGSDGPS